MSLTIVEMPTLQVTVAELLEAARFGLAAVNHDGFMFKVALKGAVDPVDEEQAMAQPMQQQHVVRAVFDRNGEPKAEATIAGRKLVVGQALDQTEPAR